VTKDALKARGVLADNADIPYVFYYAAEESSDHLLFSCPFAYSVQTSIDGWIGFKSAYAHSSVDHFTHHGILARGIRRKRLRHLIWLAVIWSLWITRNKVVFEKRTFGINEGVTKIKYLSWGWFI
jgi:hypothetical protein